MNDQTALEQIIQQIGQDATILQNTAATPHKNVWVNASAGTGKTKVLTERVLRLLLPLEGHNDGTPPENILCVTFTKAGANEMITRLMKTLSNWAVCKESDLHTSLNALLGQAPSRQQIDKARQLFAMIIDLPGGLNVTTIHALCQSILGRFVMEAGLPPNFSVMEEAEAAGLVRQARDSLVHEILRTGENHPLYQDFTWLAAEKNSDQINKILTAVLSDRKKLSAFFEEHPDYRKHIRDKLDINETDTYESVLHTFLYQSLPENDIRQLARAFEHGAKGNQESAFFLYDFLAGDRQDLFKQYKSVFLTQAGEMQKKGVTAGAQKQDPQALDIFTGESERLIACDNHLKSLTIYKATTAILELAQEITKRYQGLKIAKRKVDYDDLIHKTHDLLNGPVREWVLFKLDYGIDHILVDEAQDTSPEQWDIMKALWDDFYSGETAKSLDGINRTVFVVGDNKQSIFSFQGANLDVFNGTHDYLATQVKQAQKPWEDVPMNTSFRSSTAILSVVDLVFDDADLRRSLTQNPDQYKPHTAFRQGHAGLVEIWPLYKAPNPEDLKPWSLPLAVREGHDANQALANRIAETIKNWIDNETLLKPKGRAIKAGDIMILVRRRNALVNHMIRALKTHNVPVSGADRLVVSDHIAVQDVLAALHFALMPDDDLMLATLLKSPFIGWDDATLEDYAYGRERTLWHEIKNRAPSPVVSWLTSLIESMTGQTTFAGVSALLNLKAAETQQSGWQALIKRLGEDCIDPLEELLSIAQTYDANNPAAGIQGFLHYMETNKTEIKREMESGEDKVRIMTVHASKGLQAPIVFMPDTTGVPSKSSEGLLWLDGGIPLWSPSSESENNLIKTYKDGNKSDMLDEYYRLLYVAMTRAEDRLIICGTLNNRDKKPSEKSWYSCALKGLETLDAQDREWPHDPEYEAKDANTPYLTFETNQDIDADTGKEDTVPDMQRPMPEWLTMPLKAEHHPPRILKPSQDESEAVPVRSPLQQGDDSHRFRRGLLTHSLLQYLPDISAEKRQEAGAGFLNRQGPDLSEDLRNEILSESLAILRHDDFAPFFGEGSMAEVPVTGTVTNNKGKVDIISGQIDRLLVTKTHVWIIDFKSNRPPPRDPEQIPLQYKKQLKAYKTLIQDIYPNHKIRCALLWTDGPFITEFKDI